MLALVAVMAVVIPLALAVFLTVRSLLRNHAGAAWWVAMSALLVLGVFLGNWFLDFQYGVSEDMRFQGVPFPVGAEHLEQGQWVCYVTYGFLVWGDLIVGLVLPVTPLSVTYWVYLRRKRGKAAGTPSVAQEKESG